MPRPWSGPASSLDWQENHFGELSYDRSYDSSLVWLLAKTSYSPKTALVSPASGTRANATVPLPTKWLTTLPTTQFRSNSTTIVKDVIWTCVIRTSKLNGPKGLVPFSGGRKVVAGKCCCTHFFLDARFWRKGPIGWPLRLDVSRTSVRRRLDVCPLRPGVMDVRPT